MNQILKPLYEHWEETCRNTPEFDFALDVFCKSENITPKQANYNCDILVECVCAENERAFSAGFQTAVQLLTGGGQ